MTLNITVTTGRCIYQSADYRLMDVTSGKTYDFETQKIVLVNTFTWSATVCFAGVGRAHKLDVSEWLAERVASIAFGDPFERLLDELLTANSWLSAVPPPHNRHTFSVGAFVGSEPVFALVSNYEQPWGLPAQTAAPRLSVHRLRPKKPMTFTSGQKQAVTPTERKRLAALAARHAEPAKIYSALVEVNRCAAARTPFVSSACYTTHVRLTGEGGGCVHGIDDRPFLPAFGIPPEAREVFERIIDEQFGPGQAQIRSMTIGRSDPSDDNYHQTQIREKPDDPGAHSNYGVYLKDKKRDLSAAEREYRQAIEFDPNHVNALGNLANLLWEKGDKDQAGILYRRALAAGPGNENVTWNYARFLIDVVNDRKGVREVLDRGILTNPDSGRLLLLRADLSLRERDALAALEDFRRAREKGANPAEVEAGYSFALHLTGALIDDCIAAYRTAIGLNPKNGELRLNLAQLLFIKGDGREASRYLEEAMKFDLNEAARHESNFYLLAHTPTAPADILCATRSLLNRGVLLDWDVRANIEVVRQRDPQKAELLELVAGVMAAERNQVFLDQVLARWR
jgi:Flp pilus assembly protein TadD